MTYKVGEIVWYKANKDGSRPYSKWAGEIKKIKVTDENLTIYNIKFDPDYNSKAFLDGCWLTEDSIDLAPENMKIGFN